MEEWNNNQQNKQDLQVNERGVKYEEICRRECVTLNLKHYQIISVKEILRIWRHHQISDNVIFFFVAALLIVDEFKTIMSPITSKLTNNSHKYAGYTLLFFLKIQATYFFEPKSFLFRSPVFLCFEI